MPIIPDFFGLHGLLRKSAYNTPKASALGLKSKSLDYTSLASSCARFASGLRGQGLQQGLGVGDRVMVYLPKTFESVIALFGTTWAGGVMIPVNPVLKLAQVGHILRNSRARYLVTSRQRALALAAITKNSDLQALILVDAKPGEQIKELPISCISWEEFTQSPPAEAHPNAGHDTAAILYTSGSTGRPKGVELSHDNLVIGAASVSEYLENTPEDRLLAVLPLSFDYGLSQLTTAFHVGAHVQLMDYLLPRDVIRAVARFGITGLAGVPPLWLQLAQLPWPAEAVESLRYLTNSGGTFPVATIEQLKAALPNSQIVPMYGLTEAFRSSYLPASELAQRPESMGKAIPNAELHVLREDGSECAANEIGELVHCGPLVAKGYWNNKEASDQRFRPYPADDEEAANAVWSGDLVSQDEQGFLYFQGRRDDMIKSSGYRISPSEIEEVLYASGTVGEVAAFGIPHQQLGQAVVIAITGKAGSTPDKDAVLEICKTQLPAFMVPSHVEIKDALPRNSNGKMDRKALAEEIIATLNNQS